MEQNISRRSFLKGTAAGAAGLLMTSLIGCEKVQAEPETEAADTAPVQETAEAEAGYVRGKVLTDSGEMVTAGIIVQDEAGNTYRTVTNPLSGYYLKLAPGNYTLIFTRGFEYSVITKEVTVESYKKTDVQDVRLVHLYDSYAKGWFGGDIHQHTMYSDGADTVHELLMGNISSGLYWGFLSDHNSAMGLSEWVQGNRVVANIGSSGEERRYRACEAVEVTTEYGHYQSIGVGMTFDLYEVTLRDSERGRQQAEKDEIIKERIIYIAETIRRNGGVPQINHPYSSSSMGFNYWEIADYFDTIEIWNGVFVPGDGRYEAEEKTSWEQNYRSKRKWFELLNEVKKGGKFFAATGGTDIHSTASHYKNEGGGAPAEITNMAQYKEAHSRSGLYNGMPATYLRIEGEWTLENIQEALRRGNSFITNGPIVIADVDGRSYGETASLGDGTVTLNIDAFSRDGWEGIRIVKNGEVIETIDITEEACQTAVSLNGIESGDWIVLEGLGTGVGYCITNPIFFQK
jgi:hypothetical protein